MYLNSSSARRLWGGKGGEMGGNEKIRFATGRKEKCGEGGGPAG